VIALLACAGEFATLRALGAAAAAADSSASSASSAAPATQRLPPPPAAPPCGQPLCYTASRLEAERNHLAATNIDIVDTTRGTTQIKADRAEASGLDLGNARWILTGHVQVYLPQGQLQANIATIQFADSRIASIDVQGEPAQFAREVPRGGQSEPTEVTGHAQQISYNVAREQVQLNGDSWLTDGCNDISTQQIIYYITSQRVEASAGAGNTGQVHGTIGPRTGAVCTAGPAQP
jgi:lipopolysaccharide transport protein LptA